MFPQALPMEILAIFVWWLWIQLISLAALPLAWRLFSHLPDRGYTLSKALGLLLWGYVLWLGATVGVLHNTLGGGLSSIIVVALVSAWLGREGVQRDERGRRPLARWLRAQRRFVLVAEGIFLLSLALWALVRAQSPDIATAGGEKFMEIAFLNGILNSHQFPPRDPWLAGYAISYYYFGYVIVAGLIRLSGLPPSVGFNVGFASLFALTVLGAFGVTANLVPYRYPGGVRGANRLAARPGDLPLHRAEWGVLGAVLVTLMGNLEGFLEVLYARRLLPAGFWRWLDIKDINVPPDPAQPVSWMPQRFIWWWRASRVIHDKDLLGNSMEVIDEFPGFSFVLGDMHPHVLVLPFVLLVIGLVMGLYLRREEEREEWGGGGIRRWIWEVGERAPHGWVGFVLYALALGALAFLNTWDFPIYLGLVMVVWGWREATARGRVDGRVLRDALGVGVALGVAGVFLYLPFYLGFQSQAGGVLPNLFNPTRLAQFFVMFGPFLVTMIAFFWLLTVGSGVRPVVRATLGWLPWTLLLPWALVLVILGGLVFTAGGREFINQVFSNPVVAENVGGRSMGQLVAFIARRRVTTLSMEVMVAVLVAWALGLLTARLRARAPEENGGKQVSWAPGDALAVTLFGFGLLLTYAVEFVYLKDLFGTRMNTVFKFYFQAWVLWAVAGTYALAAIMARARGAFRLVSLTMVGALIVLGLIYPLFAIPARSELGQVGVTLNGEAWIKQVYPDDYAVILWVRENTQPDAVILEATGGSYSFFGRVAAFTGRPTLLGWDFHEYQWRGAEALQQQAGTRGEDMQRIYRQARGQELLQLLHQYDVDYVVVGTQERQKYGLTDQSLRRFDEVLELVFEQGKARVYRVPE